MFTSAHNAKHGSVCCSKQAPLPGEAASSMVAGDERREGCLFVPGVEDRSRRRQLCACYGPAQTVSGRAFLLRCCSLSLRPGLRQSPGSETQGRAVKPRERGFARKICLRGLPLPKVTGGRHFTFLSGLLCTVQFELGGFSDLSLL